MAPERAQGLLGDERADLYALGALLYFVLAGVPPHEPIATMEPTLPGGGPAPTEGVMTMTATDYITAAATRTPVPLQVRRGGIPGELDAIVQKALQRERSERYPTAKEFAEG